MENSHTHIYTTLVDSCARLIRVNGILSGVCRVHIAITCNRLEWGKACMQSDNDRVEVGQVRGWSHPDFFFDPSRSLVWTDLPTFDPIPKRSIVFISSSTKRPLIDVEEFSTNFKSRVFCEDCDFNLHARFLSNATRNEQLPWNTVTMFGCDVIGRR